MHSALFLALVGAYQAAYADTATCDVNGFCTPALRTIYDKLSPPLDSNGNTNTSGNVVTVHNTPTGKEIFVVGALRQDHTAVDNNQVIINNGNIDEIYGGYSAGGNTTDNKVIINGGTINDVIKGGISGGNGNATKNIVTINGGTIANRVYGGFSYFYNATR